MAQVPEHEPHKRKRDLEDDGSHPAHHRHPSMQSSSSLALMAPESVVNFVTRPNAPLLSFLPGDVETFNDLIYLVNEYDAVLDRKESMAANLGAKLTGPRFLRGLERFFEGPIKILSANIYHQITWLEIVTYAKTNPEAFTVMPLPSGSRCCRFVYNGVQAEIIEDDWRLISSGALDRFPLEYTFEEDEAAELATLEILEQRASYLHRKADELAGRAHLLHQRLEIRIRDVARRQQLLDAGTSCSAPSSSGSSSSSSSFQAINQPQRPVIANPGSAPPNIHTDLLHQFSVAAMQNGPPQGPPPGYHAQPASPNAGPAAGQTLTAASNSKSIATMALSQVALPGDPANEVHRPLVLQKTDTLNKGEIIFPPCDRCRRLRLQCVKHLTACRGCTKKHARCNWRNVTDEEAADVREELAVIYKEAKNAAAAAKASRSAKAAGKAPASAPPPPPPASGSSAGPSTAASQGNMNMDYEYRPVLSPAAGPAPVMPPMMPPALAPALAPAPAAEPPRRLLPTTRLTRIEPAPTVPRNPPRTGHLAAILSPPDYEPRPFGTLPPLAPR
ncbi:uncharacterized protein TRIVIDRAFT_71258 [Trichoderma virens Gv29-8]|uniref:Zn(2)-C6 fungal-type domain-containing protein n=1 Tax=Hypocrea virens (strain Gv29-8 / FGSC 10586) TaxID=413071 RepID=G9MR80_HYPVG|nr:uncharacterized protein TRIVIDRAFT_71258 [Trichoderma virens Gv29-8]EHK22605.1 hypothetical protein TRIVIDRAFT_71258 [Trichoderma virens Gv29-8]